MAVSPSPRAGRKSAPKYRVGRVTIHLRGDTWHVYYFEDGQRVRRKLGPNLSEAKQLAAQINGQLASGAPGMMSFEPITIPALRQRWLDYHEHVLRSAVSTIRRYRAATDHLLNFIQQGKPVPSADRMTSAAAELFARHLRAIQVAPNGHPNAAKVSLRDKGVLFILETCRAMFNYAKKHRHLKPYHENPFGEISLSRLPVEDAKPIVPFTPEQEAAFLSACDPWQLPIFLTLALTGMRSGEATHLLIPDDVDLEARVLRVRSKASLGWRTKTRNHREIPFGEDLAAVLRRVIGGRSSGPLFMRRRFAEHGEQPLLACMSAAQLGAEIARRREERRSQKSEWTRLDDARVAQEVWRDAGVIRECRLRLEYMRVTEKIGLGHMTCPKTLRHLFATCLQDANVDPLIRQELMGHVPAVGASSGLGMTAVYTHTRETTRRGQLEAAMAGRLPALTAARVWLGQSHP
jgi:integrase